MEVDSGVVYKCTRIDHGGAYLGNLGAFARLYALWSGERGNRRVDIFDLRILESGELKVNAMLDNGDCCVERI